MKKDCSHSCSMLGAFFACAPLEDSSVVCHGPMGCVKMMLYAACAHDLAGFDRAKVTVSDVGGSEAVMGGAEKLRAHIERLLRRSPGRRVFVITSCIPEIVGDDLEDVRRSFAPGAVTLLGGAGFRGDLWAGYSAALERIAADLCIEKPGRAPSKKSVNLLGYVCDRLEEDHLANLSVLRAMVRALGLEVNAVFTGPGGTRGLRRAWAAGLNVAFDYGMKAAGRLSRRYGQETVHAAYPLGLRGTSAFLRTLGRACGRAAGAEKSIEEGLRRAVPRIQALRSVCVGRRAGVCAESQKLPGLLESLLDLGMRPVWIRVADRQEDVIPRLRQVLGEGFERVRLDPPFEAETEGVDLVVGGSAEKYRCGERVPVYEFTYPCFDRHCLTAEPDLGFEGAVRLANNLANLLTRANTRAWGLSRELSRMGFEPVLHLRGGAPRSRRRK